MASGVPSFAEFLPIDTRQRSGTILLPPVNAVPGRILTFKDMYGNFSLSSLTLSTLVGNTFDDNSSQKIMRETYGYVTLVSNGLTKWNIVEGTIFPMYTFSTLVNSIEINVANSNSISTNRFFSPISSIGTQVSTIGFKDQQLGFKLPIYAKDTLLYYGTSIVGGSKTAVSQSLTAQ
jgi:hypothetical protein